MSAAPQLENLFTELKPQRVWLPWKAVKKADGKISKVPYNVRGVKSNDRASDVTFDELCAFLKGTNGEYAGAGIHIPPGFVCVDLDNCVSLDAGGNPVAVAISAKEIVQTLPTYCELSPNKTGLHLWMRGSKPGKKCRRDSVEIYSGDDELRFMTVTGWHLEETPTTIEACDISSIYEGMVSGTLTASKESSHSPAPAAQNEPAKIQSEGKTLTSKIELLMHGDILSTSPFVVGDAHGNTLEYRSQSEGDSALAVLLAFKYAGDIEKMDADFRVSSLYREKWERDDYSAATLKSAVDFWKKNGGANSHAPAGTVPEEIGYGTLEFKYPAVQGTPFDFVIGPALGASDGWFPRGDPSLVGGPSGSNKSTLLTDLLEAQKKHETFLGHETFGLPYLILMADRGKNAHTRTAKRMRYDPNVIPIEFLPTVWGAAALRAILQKIEAVTPIPAVVFVEGCDTLVENASKMEVVAPFMEGLQKIASHYHIALIGSVGAPKERVGEGYIATRDNIIGSVVWSRKSETIACLKYVKGDDTDRRRKLVVLPRNAGAEKFDMKLEDGRLVVDHSAVEESAPKVGGDIAWYRAQGDWFTPEDVRAAWKMSRAQAYRCVTEAFTKHILKTKQKVTGEARQYRWNDKETNPYNSKSETEQGKADAS
jgi:hypothetical protein